MQFLWENHLNGCQIFGRFGFLKTESELNFGFPHMPMCNDRIVNCVTVRTQVLNDNLLTFMFYMSFVYRCSS